MIVTLDGEALSTNVGEGLAGALQAASDAARAKGRVIIEVKADGAAIPADQLTRHAQDQTAFRELALVSADPRTLVQVTFSDGAEALRELGAEQKRIAGLIHRDQVQDALPALQSVFLTWQMVRDLVERCGQLLEVRFDDVPVPTGDGAVSSSTLSQASASLLAQLHEVKRALRDEDWSALADLLEYDLAQQADAWEAMLNGFARHAAALPKGTA